MNNPFSFPTLPLCCVINNATDGGHALLNLTPGAIQIGENCQITLPPLFISDGMSVPPIADGVIEPRDGLIAGHIHDFLYSAHHEAASNTAAKAYGKSPQETADDIMRAYMMKHSPGFNRIEIELAHKAVRVFGSRHFRNIEQDQWRRKIATRLRLPGNGTGSPQNLFNDTPQTRSLIARLTWQK